MHRTCIAIVDASRARLFTLERSAEDSRIHEVLTEQRDLVNPGLDATFSRRIVDEVAALIRAVHADRVILCASARMLGELRNAGSSRLDARVIDELPRDLVKLTPAKLRDQLASYGLLPAAQRAAAM